MIFIFFQFITALLFLCAVCWRFISVDNCCNLQVNYPSHSGLAPVIELAFATAISHAGSHGEFHHVRRHDKRQGLICIHEALRKFKEKLQSRMERAGSSQTVQTVSILDITISP